MKIRHSCEVQLEELRCLTAADVYFNSSTLTSGQHFPQRFTSTVEQTLTERSFRVIWCLILFYIIPVTYFLK